MDVRADDVARGMLLQVGIGTSAGPREWGFFENLQTGRVCVRVTIIRKRLYSDFPIQLYFLSLMYPDIQINHGRLKRERCMFFKKRTIVSLVTS